MPGIVGRDVVGGKVDAVLGDAACKACEADRTTEGEATGEVDVLVCFGVGARDVAVAVRMMRVGGAPGTALTVVGVAIAISGASDIVARGVSRGGAGGELGVGRTTVVDDAAGVTTGDGVAEIMDVSLLTTVVGDATGSEVGVMLGAIKDHAVGMAASMGVAVAVVRMVVSVGETDVAVAVSVGVGERVVRGLDEAVAVGMTVAVMGMVSATVDAIVGMMVGGVAVPLGGVEPATAISA